MRLVLDTNVVISGLLWGGSPRRLLELAAGKTATLYSSPWLVSELEDTLQYPRLAPRIASLNMTPAALATRYTVLVTQISPLDVPQVIAQDADDDQVLACAVSAQARIIVSGDKHLHSLGGVYQGIAILRPAQAVDIIEAA